MEVIEQVPKTALDVFRLLPEGTLLILNAVSVIYYMNLVIKKVGALLYAQSSHLSAYVFLILLFKLFTY